MCKNAASMSSKIILGLLEGNSKNKPPPTGLPSVWYGMFKDFEQLQTKTRQTSAQLESVLLAVNKGLSVI